MEKRIVIAGCREYEDYEEAERFIDECLREWKANYEIVIVSGGARGADALGERYAKKTDFVWKNIPRIGNVTEKVQDRNEISKWLGSATAFYAFGMGRAKEHCL